MKYKLMCYNGYVIPVPESVNWIAWDESGEAYLYQRDDSSLVYQAGRLPHPEPGPWYEQRYWIGD